MLWVVERRGLRILLGAIGLGLVSFMLAAKTSRR